MGKQVQKTKSTQQSTQQQQYTGSQQNQYGFIDTPINAQLQAVIDASSRQSGPDPAIQQRFAAMEEEVRRSKMDPMGAYTTPFVRERAQLADITKLQANRDKAMREDRFQQEGNQFNKLLAAANMTAPKFVQQGSTSSGSSSGSSTGSGTSETSQGKNLLGNILDIGMGAASL